MPVAAVQGEKSMSITSVAIPFSVRSAQIDGWHSGLFQAALVLYEGSHARVCMCLSLYLKLEELPVYTDSLVVALTACHVL